MSSDPKEFQEQAQHCAKLAAQAKDPWLKDVFAALAKTWRKLAAEFERAAAFRDSVSKERDELS